MKALKIFLNRRIKALSLIEVSIALVIIGLLIAGAMQGWKWVESARVGSTVQQILQTQTASQTYYQVHHSRPKPENFWKALSSFGGPKAQEDNIVTSSIGANFIIEAENKIKLSPLKSKQALRIKNTLDPSEDKSVGWIQIADAAGNVKKNVSDDDENVDYSIIINLN